MQLSTIANTATMTMSSREIAELTGKEHKNVLADIRKMLQDLELTSADFSANLPDAYGRQQQIFNLNKELTLTLVAGYNVKLRLAIIKRWQELEDQQKPSFSLPNFTNPAEAARAWALEFEAKLVAIEERDHAVKTKMQISDKKTATAMATASAAVRETNKLKEQLGFCSKQATVIAVENATRQKFNWTKLKAWCKQNNTQPVSVPDARFGEAKAWPAGAWLDCYGIDLAKLFKR